MEPGSLQVTVSTNPKLRLVTSDIESFTPFISAISDLAAKRFDVGLVVKFAKNPQEFDIVWNGAIIGNFNQPAHFKRTRGNLGLLMLDTPLIVDFPKVWECFANHLLIRGSLFLPLREPDLFSPDIRLL